MWLSFSTEDASPVLGYRERARLTYSTNSDKIQLQGEGFVPNLEPPFMDKQYTQGR